MNFAIEVERGQAEALIADAKAASVEVSTFEPKRFDGATELAVLVVPLATAAVPYLAKIILAQIEARRHVKVKIDGVEIQGLSAHNTHSLLETIVKSKTDAKR